MTNHINNVEEYEHPDVYDQENNGFTDDVRFLSQWAANIDGVIIDIACGTGRATIPLAMEGHQLIGVDLHRGMLDKARTKSSHLFLPIDWVEQDCSNLQLDMKSKFIYSTGNSFQHFLTNEDQDGLLSSVNRHLEVGGTFIFGTRFPSAEELLQPPTEEYWSTYTDQDTQHQVDVYTISRYDSLQQIQHYTTTRRMKDLQGCLIHESSTNIRLRYVYPEEMKRILSSNGFEIVHLYKDWKGTPLTEESYEMIYVCEKVNESV